jgi:hypothetical protein
MSAYVLALKIRWPILLLRRRLRAIPFVGRAGRDGVRCGKGTRVLARKKHYPQA